MDILVQQQIAKALRFKKQVKKVPRMLYPSGAEYFYKTALLSYVKRLREVVTHELDKTLPIIESELRGEQGFKLDTWADDVERMVNNMRKQFDVLQPAMGPLIDQTADKENNAELKEWKKVMRSVLGVELYQSEPWLKPVLASFARQNVNLIKSLTEDLTTQINTIVNTGFSAGKRWETIKKELVGTKLEGLPGVPALKKVENRARLIARDQVSKLNGNLTRLRQKSLGIDKYVWRTAMDERVRPSHNIMEDILCRWDNPSVMSKDGGKTWIARPGNAVKQHPGEDYQCRCYGEPYFDEVVNELAPEIKPAPIPAPVPVVKSTFAHPMSDFYDKNPYVPMPAKFSPEGLKNHEKQLEKLKKLKEKNALLKQSVEGKKASNVVKQKQLVDLLKKEKKPIPSKTPKLKGIVQSSADPQDIKKYTTRSYQTIYDFSEELDRYDLEAFDSFKVLSSEERQAIRDYTHQFDKLMNKEARQKVGKKLKGTDAAYLEDALSKLTVGRDLKLVRGFNGDINEVVSAVGTVKKDWGFMSTSVTRPFEGNIQMVVDVPKETKGAFIRTYSRYKRENEVLLNRGTRYFVHKVEPIKIQNKRGKWEDAVKVFATVIP